ncbi:iron complex outermembrane receptor protein [Chromohalobacter marismortui]|uniref:Iron complex outermembrane receptor protein n=1 Tax=Chromohalobacter marismortui TaxID=42055 RepID=A0A4R7NRV3_9GAMM|nr:MULTISPECIES: TonB-dependent siderophore receptor [Chromohalobacter]MCI0592381.1 TonB-dependent siderophore receptor [Chromohalobacter sp.]TDU23558.1 iron complex outermembrane receptor protein [Chromohalobacter marismortui]
MNTSHPFSRQCLSIAIAGICGATLVPAGLAQAQTSNTAGAQASNASSVELPVLQVTEDRIANALLPTEGYTASTSTSATKTDTPLMKTAQSVSVVTREQIEDQGATSIQQALRYTPGVFTGGRNGFGNRYDFISMRGFGGVGSLDNIYLDGLKMAGDVSGYNSLQIDPYFLERIDVFKGPTSVLYGQSYPGGLVGLTSKRPLFTPTHEIQLEAGTHDARAARFDFSGPIGESRRAAYRLVGLASGSDSQFDHVENERYTIAPSLTLLPTDNTSLTLMAYLQHEPNSGYYGWTPADGTVRDHNGRRIDNDFFDGEPGFNGFERYQRLIGYQLKHQINDTWQAQQNFRFASSDIDYDQIYSSGWVGDSNQLNRRVASANESLHAYKVDNQLQGNFTTGPLSHTLLVGLDYQYQRNSGSWRFGAATPLNAFDPEYGNTQVTYGAPTNFINKVEQTGVYLQDQISLGQWRFNLAGRQDWADTSTAYTNLGMASKSDSKKFTSRASLLYAFDNGVSPYVSYSESFEPASATNIDASGNTLDPSEASQYELGLKYQPPGSNDQYTAAIYHLEQENVSEAIPNSPFYEAIGKVRSRGLELSAKLHPTEQLSLIASYTYTDMEYVETNDETEGNTPYGVPRHMASAWGKYEFAGGMLNGLGVGAGVRYNDSTWGNDTHTFEVDSYTLVDAMLEYDLGMLSSDFQGMNVRVNANNLLDKDYVSSCSSTTICHFGAERNVTATLSYNW